jgi:uncharacterized protein DUF6970
MATRCRFVLAVAVLLAACTAQNPAAPEPPPTFVESLIRQLSTQPVANPPASITRYDYKGQVVYYVPPRCCDIRGDVYLTDGKLLCQPDGGFDGRGDGRCPDFFTTRRNEYIVWRDPRPPS